MAETDNDQAEMDHAALVAKVESHDHKLDQILAVLDKFTGGPPATHQAAQTQTENRLDRPSTVAEQVRAELAKAEQERASQTAADEDKSEREQLRERLAKLEETRPEPPQPRRQRVMWGAR